MTLGEDGGRYGLGHCPACGGRVTVPLPVEPVYRIDTVAVLLGLSVEGLRSALTRYKSDLSPARYRRRGRTQFRMLTASDVRALRERTLHPTLRGQGKVARANAEKAANAAAADTAPERSAWAE
jgi:hypothetical protein